MENLKGRVLMEIKCYDREKEKRHRLRNILNKIYDNIDKFDMISDFSYNVFCDMSFTVYDDFDKLTKLRKVLRTVFGDWKDEMEYVTYESNIKKVRLRYAYRGNTKRNLLIQIHLYMDEDKLPDSITHNGKCKFIEEEHEAYTRKVFVCDKNN